MNTDTDVTNSESNTAFLVTIAGGIALIVLTIMSLSKFDSSLLNSVAVIVGGIVALIGGGRLPGQYVRALSQHADQGIIADATSGGLSAGVMAGGTAIVLGILAIIGLVPEVLDAIAAIVLGGTLLFDFVTRTQIGTLRAVGPDASAQALRLAISVNAATVMIAVALITLGILALAQVASLALIAIAFLILGTYYFLVGTAVITGLFDLIP